VKGPYPFHRYEITHVPDCEQVLIELKTFRLEYWYFYHEIVELSREPSFFRPLYKLALTLIPKEALDANPISDMPSLLAHIQHPSRCEQRAAPSYPRVLPEVLQRSNSSGDSSS
jgi:hypothetical protein